MGMSGKTFLSAFQMGAKMYPDMVKSREDEIDRKAKRKVINLQKKKLKEDRDLAEKLKERETVGMTSLNTFKTGYEALDMNDPRFPSQWRKLVKDNITGIGMSKRSLEGFNTIKETVIGNEIFKAKEEAEADALVAIDWWNKHNPLKKVGPDTPPDFLDVVNDSYKDHLQEEKNKALRADIEAKGEAETALKDKATFTAFIEETGSAFNPEDYEKPEAKTALRIHNQLEEVKDLVMEVGEEGMPIMGKLKVKPDGSGYENLMSVKAKLKTLALDQALKKSGSGRSMSEAESNSFIFSERMRFDNQIMDQMVIEGVAPSKRIVDGWIASKNQNSAFSISNALLDPKFQQWKSAADNFIRATLRRESGAAIADHEYVGGFKDYIELLGDSPGLVKQKRDLRLGITNAMRKASRVPWEDSVFHNRPMRFESLEQANSYKGNWLNEGDTGEYYDAATKSYIPFTVGKSKEEAIEPPKPKAPKAPNPNIRKVPRRKSSIRN